MTEENFEKKMKNLEKIVSRLENEEVALEESMKLFEEGVKLSRLCSEELDKAEKKVEILLKDSEGNLKKEPFSSE